MYELVRDQATRTLKWAALAQLLGRFAQPAILILMARILNPGDYGVLEISILTITLGQLLLDMGLSKALIQTREDQAKAANIVFWSNVTLGIVLFVVIFLTADWIAAFFREPQVAPILRVASLQLPILSLAVVQMAIAQQQLRYERQFGAMAAAGVVMIASTLILVGLGLGLWAFVFGSLIGSATQVIAYWLIAPWRPSLRGFELSLAPQLLGFGSLATIEVLGGWLLNYGDNIVLGRFLGVNALGTYALAFNIAVLGIGLVMNPIISVAYASFSRLSDDWEKLQMAFSNTVHISAVLVIPLAVGVFLLADQISEVILQGRWPGIASVIRILVISPGLTYIMSINPELYRAIDRADIMPRVLLAAIAYSLPAYLVGAHFGLLGFALARLSVGIVFLPIHLRILSKTLGIPASYLLDAVKIPVLAAAVMAAAVLLVLAAIPDLRPSLAWLTSLAAASIGAIIYITALWILDRKIVLRGLALARLALRSGANPDHA